MHKTATFALASVLLASGIAFADDRNPDQVPQKPAAPHVFLSMGGGASVSSVDAGDVHYLSGHAHFDLAIGHELLAGGIGGDRGSLALARPRHGRERRRAAP